MKQIVRVAALTLSATLFLSSCATQPTTKIVESAEPEEKIIKGSFDDIWRAVQLAMAPYPIKVNNQDAGILETESVRGEAAWVSPGKKPAISGGFRYRIIIRVVRGRLEDDKKAAKVTILKLGEVQRDFFSAFEKLPSDGLEELAIMYRVERELSIERTLRKSDLD